MMRTLARYLVALVVFLNFQPSHAAWAHEPVATNIILMIGDGMGYEQVKAASYYIAGATGQLSFEPHYVCSVRTLTANNRITDSAAAGTALATGYKVASGVVSQATDGTPYETILEYAQTLGKSTGLVTNTPITHSTPACFAAHQPSRHNFLEIGDDYLYGARPNLIFGGGDPTEVWTPYFTPAQLAYAGSIGYQLVRTREEMTALPAATQRVLGLFAHRYMAVEFDRPPLSAEPRLSQMTAKALEILDTNPRGFFLKVEGGIIDGAAHGNDLVRLVHEVIEFHYTARLVLHWLAERDDTLLLIVADHETGGLTVENQGAGVYPSATWTTLGHSDADVPLYAAGVGLDIVESVTSEGPIHLVDIHRIMKAAMRNVVEHGPSFLGVH